MKIEQLGILTSDRKLLYVYDDEPVDTVTDINEVLFFVKGERVLQVDG